MWSEAEIQSLGFKKKKVGERGASALRMPDPREDKWLPRPFSWDREKYYYVHTGGTAERLKTSLSPTSRSVLVRLSVCEIGLGQGLK